MSKFWNEERVSNLEGMVKGVSLVTQDMVEGAAESLGTSARSVGSKLRKMGYEVQKASEVHTSGWEAGAAAELRSFLENNAGKYTYAEIAAAFRNGEFNAKSVQGKVLSMEMTNLVKPAEKPVVDRKYSAEEEKTFIALAQSGASIEKIAEAVGKSINSVRGKALSLSRQVEGFVVPRQEKSHATAKVDEVAGLGDLSKLSVSDIAEKTGKTERGVKTLLTRRGIACADYDGAKKAEKREAKKAAS